MVPSTVQGGEIYSQVSNSKAYIVLNNVTVLSLLFLLPKNVVAMFSFLLYTKKLKPKSSNSVASYKKFERMSKNSVNKNINTINNILMYTSENQN